MQLTKLSLEHFRNIGQIELELAPGINILLGENGQGKTNTLEAIFALSLARPFRNREKEVFLKYGEQYGRVKGEVESGETESELLEIFWENFDIKRNNTVFKRNGVEKSSTEYLEQKHFFAVLFAPEDMEMPFALPKKRRQYLSRVLSPIFPEYLTATMKYEKILRHRNKLLSTYHLGKIQKMEFDFWDAELSKWGKIISKYRQEFVEFVTKNIQKKYELISEKKDPISFEFLPSVPFDQDLFPALAQNFSQDVQYRSTQKGPHRDDFEIFLRSKPLIETASRGEIRSALIALKLCERDFTAEVTSLFPILLLDDVFSELDEPRRSALLEIFQNDQVFISTTHLPKFPKEKALRIFEVQGGEFTARKNLSSRT